MRGVLFVVDEPGRGQEPSARAAEGSLLRVPDISVILVSQPDRRPMRRARCTASRRLRAFSLAKMLRTW